MTALALLVLRLFGHTSSPSLSRGTSAAPAPVRGPASIAVGDLAAGGAARVGSAADSASCRARPFSREKDRVRLDETRFGACLGRAVDLGGASCR